MLLMDNDRDTCLFVYIVFPRDFMEAKAACFEELAVGALTPCFYMSLLAND